MSGPNWRCIGPWPLCGHPRNTCTASPAYQAAIKVKHAGSMTTPDIADLCKRLRGEYRIPITDGLGSAGGEEPENAEEFVRRFETAPIQHEAADTLERQAAEIERLWEALSEAELDVGDMERERAFWRSLEPKGRKQASDCKTDYERELYSLWQYEIRQRDTWRGIASAMGYEPNAHNKVKPTQAWLLERVAMFRARAALTGEGI